MPNQDDQRRGSINTLATTGCDARLGSRPIPLLPVSPSRHPRYTYTGMKRTCDKCDQEATVHEVIIKNGEKVEKHLCEQHARDEGIVVHTDAPISELITKFVMSQSGKAPRSPGHISCSACGLTWDEFRQRGLLGCGQCYAEFEDQLGPMIERAHEGGAHHVGKAPKRSEGLFDRERRISILRRQLSQAVAAEQYERAASLRDELLQVEGNDEEDDDRGEDSE